MYDTTIINTKKKKKKKRKTKKTHPNMGKTLVLMLLAHCGSLKRGCRI